MAGSVRLSINRACSYGIPVTEIDKTFFEHFACDARSDTQSVSGDLYAKERGEETEGWVEGMEETDRIYKIRVG